MIWQTTGNPLHAAAQQAHRARWRIILATIALSCVLAIIAAIAPHSFPLLFVPLLLCGAAVAWALGPARAQPPCTESAKPSAGRLGLMELCAFFGLACALLAAFLEPSDPLIAQVWWGLGMAVPILGCIIASLSAGTVARLLATHRTDLHIAGGLFLLALLLRLPDLTASPGFVHGDEAMCGLWARAFNAGGISLLSIGWHGLPVLSYAVGGLALRLFGDDLLGLRTGSALLGSATVVLTYLLARQLFTRRAAVLSAGILATGFLAATFSRTGLHDIQGPAWTVLVVYLMVLWLRHGGALTALLVGMAMVLSVTMHWSARISPLLVCALLAQLALPGCRARAARVRELPWMAVGLLASGLPIASMFLANPGSIDARDTAISIFSSSVAAHQQAVYGTTALSTILPQQVWRTVQTLYVMGDNSTLIAWPHGMFDPLTAALCAPAILVCLRRWRSWPEALLLVWIASVLGASVLTIDPPWWPRLAPLLPAIALSIGMLLDELLHAAGDSRPTRRLPGWPVLAALLIPIVAINAHILFVDYPNSTAGTRLMAQTVVGRYLATAPGRARTVLVSDSGVTLQAPTIQFLAPYAGGCTVGRTQTLDACARVLHAPRLFIVLPGRLGTMAEIEIRYPGGTVSAIGTAAGTIMAYTLPPM